MDVKLLDLKLLIMNINRNPFLEGALASLIALSFVYIALFFYQIFPPWIDEVMFIDPAVNFAQSKGFVSSAWPYQNSREFFLGNAPLYSFITGLWFKVFGFGLIESRVLNYLFISLAVIVIWYTLYRSSWVEQPVHRLLAVLVMLAGNGLFHSYYSARYDGIGILIAAICYFAMYSDINKPKRALIILMGILIPFAGFHLVVVCGILGIISVYIYRSMDARLVTLAIGVVIGLGLLFGLAAYNGLLEKFILITFGSQHTVSGQLGKAVMTGDFTQVLNKLLNILNVFTTDKSFLLILLGLLSGLIFVKNNEKKYFPRSEIETRIGMLIIMPLCLFIIGKFPHYYSWIVFIPAVLFILQWLERSIKFNINLYRYVLTFTIVAAVWFGLPLQLNLRLESYNDYSYQKFEKNIKSELKNGDVVYADFESYFPARSIASQVFVKSYGKTKFVDGIPENSDINVLIIDSKTLDEVSALIPGNWIAGNLYQSSKKTLTIYRREKPALAHKIEAG